MENISLNYSDEGWIETFILIRDQGGNLIAQIKNNLWKVAEEIRLDRNYANDMLGVVDEHENVLLRVRLLEDRLQIVGIFYDISGNGIAVVPVKDGIGLIVLDPGEAQPKIEPVFIYPSELYLGELR